MRVTAVIPAYRVQRHIAAVIAAVPPVVERIVVVDDACPEHSGEAAARAGDPRVVVVRHERNRGVGGAMKTGIKKALELGCDFVVKLDGDGQMDPAYLPRLLAPLAAGEAAYSKGNRFWFVRELDRMPFLRRLGNLALSFMVKAASGQWSVFDPTNGYVAARADVLASLDLDKLADDYFFEISVLIELGKRAYRVADIPMPSVYGDEVSSLRIRRVLLSFPPRLLRRGASRFVFRHFWYGFSATALFVLAGAPLLAWGVGFGGWAWWRSIETGTPATAGTVMLAALPLLTGFQLLLQAANHEVASSFNNRVTPDGPVHVG